MKKIFISQPMPEGMTEEDIKKERRLIVAILMQHFDSPVEVINSIIEEDAPLNTKSLGLWYLGKSLEALAQADLIYMHNGWETRRGCIIERKCAEFYGIEILYADPNSNPNIMTK